MGDHTDYSDGGSCLGKIGKVFRNVQDMGQFNNSVKFALEKLQLAGLVPEHANKGVYHSPDRSAHHSTCWSGGQSTDYTTS